jgi:AcrR family transcriptional regulator
VGVGGPAARPDDVESSPQERILEATFKVVRERTLSALRMPLIAKVAGVSSATIHYHFVSKANLLQALSDWLLAAFAELRIVPTGRQAPWGGTPAEKLDALLLFQRMLCDSDGRGMLRVFYDFWVQAAGGSREDAARMHEHFGLYRDQIRQALGYDEHWFQDPGRRINVAIALSLLEGGPLQSVVDPAMDVDAYFDRIRDLITSLATASDPQ